MYPGLTVFLGEKATILEILESESNQLSVEDKFNRVDIKARNSKDEIIIEIQNTRELYYLERILYGVANAITEHISLGETYYKVKKIYSISVLYFDIGKGSVKIEFSSIIWYIDFVKGGIWGIGTDCFYKK